MDTIRDVASNRDVHDHFSQMGLPFNRVQLVLLGQHSIPDLVRVWLLPVLVLRINWDTVCPMGIRQEQTTGTYSTGTRRRGGGKSSGLRVTYLYSRVVYNKQGHVIGRT